MELGLQLLEAGTADSPPPAAPAAALAHAAVVGPASTPGPHETIDVLCMACEDQRCDFKPMAFERRALGPNDILIDMKYCGVCHSDLHFAAGHVPKFAMPASYPAVPGHELAGICTAVGADVTRITVGSKVGVGCLVDSCQSCRSCRKGEEHMCMKQAVGTYGFKGTRAKTPCGYTLGGCVCPPGPGACSTL
jgi:hypothetical protein